MKRLSLPLLFLLSFSAVAQQEGKAPTNASLSNTTLSVIKEKGREYQYYVNADDERVLQGYYNEIRRFSDRDGSNVKVVRIKGQYKNDKREGLWILTKTNATTAEITDLEKFTYKKGVLSGPSSIYSVYAKSKSAKANNGSAKTARLININFNAAGLPTGRFLLIRDYNPVHGEYLSCNIQGRFDQLGRYDGEWLISYQWRDKEVFEDRRTFKNGVLAKWVNKSITKGVVNGRLDSTSYTNKFFEKYDSLANISIVNGIAYSLDTRPAPQQSVKSSYSDTAFPLEDVIMPHLKPIQVFDYAENISVYDRIQPEGEAPLLMADIVTTRNLMSRYKRFLYEIPTRQASDLESSFRSGNLEENESAFLKEWERIRREEMTVQQIENFVKGAEKVFGDSAVEKGSVEILAAALSESKQRLQVGKTAYYQAFRKKTPERAKTYASELTIVN